MDLLYYKYTFKYNVSPTEIGDAVVYQETNTATDITSFYNDKGDVIYLSNANDYIIKVASIVSGNLFEDIKKITISRDEFLTIFDNDDLDY